MDNLTKEKVWQRETEVCVYYYTNESMRNTCTDRWLITGKVRWSMKAGNSLRTSRGQMGETRRSPRIQLWAPKCTFMQVSRQILKNETKCTYLNTVWKCYSGVSVSHNSSQSTLQWHSRRWMSSCQRADFLLSYLFYYHLLYFIILLYFIVCCCWIILYFM